VPRTRSSRSRRASPGARSSDQEPPEPFGTSSTFSFTATGNATGFECALVLRPTSRFAPTPAPSYAACSSPDTFTNLKPGSYVFYVRAVGPAGVDPTPPSYGFTIF